MRLFLLLLLVFIITPISSPVLAKAELIKYSHLGNHEGVINIPPYLRKYPVIIYNYDEYLYSKKSSLAKRKDYNLERIMAYFEERGYATFVPLERGYQLNTIRGAIKYLQNHPSIDPNRIHMMGVSQGAFLSALSIDQNFKPRSLTLISPTPIHGKGAFSIPALKRNLDEISMPVLILNGKRNTAWKQAYAKEIVRILKAGAVNQEYKHYPRYKWWFWDPDHRFMFDVMQFIKNNEPDYVDEFYHGTN